MNFYDSSRMADVMNNMGYDLCEVVDEADMIIMNTCHIREKAVEKMYSELGRVKREKKQKDVIIAVAGCVSQAEGEEIFRRAPFVNIVVGTQAYQTLPDLIGKVKRDAGKLTNQAINIEFIDNKFDLLPEEMLESKNPSAVLSIQEGCDKFCTFCVVPYTRGAEYSRTVPEIYREALKLAASGAKEITLLGQNVNAFHGQDENGKSWDLGQLINSLSKIGGVDRIRYSTSHPRDMHESLYLEHANNPKLMPFLNLPVQSGSNKILESMNRKHTREEYFKIIERLKSLRGDMQFSSDFIIGFPGETEDDFEQTLDLAKRVNFIHGYSFNYSPRPGTPGFEMKNQIPEEVKSKRLQIFQELITKQGFEFNQSCTGKRFLVLFDKCGKKEGQISGKTPYMQSVNVNNAPSAIMGQIVEVEIIAAGPNSLTGKLV